MARIRSAKPEWWTDPRMVALPRLIRWTFKGLWEVCADDEGRFLADPRVIKGQLWPMDDDLSPRQIDKHLSALGVAGRILLYVVDGVRYGVVVNFLKHQKISHPTPSRLPPPPLGALASHAGNPPESYRNGSGSSPERLRPDLSGAERDVDFDLDRSGAERRDPESSAAELIASTAPLPPAAANSAAPPAPPADAGAAEDQPRTAPPLPLAAKVLLERMPDPKREDGERQLRATLTAEGARLARGEYVRAYSVAHLHHCCGLVLDSPPDKPEQLARWVLLKLRDTFAEWRSRDDKHAAERTAPAIAAIMQPGEPIDELGEAHRWVFEHADVKREIEEAATAKFAGFPKNAGMLRRHSQWIDEQSVERWKAAGSPVAAAVHGANESGTGR